MNQINGIQLINKNQLGFLLSRQRAPAKMHQLLLNEGGTIKENHDNIMLNRFSNIFIVSVGCLVLQLNVQILLNILIFSIYSRIGLILKV